MEALKKIIAAPCAVHFIGIGGSGMLPLAQILLERGFSVTGSDSAESETLERVLALGIPVAMPQVAENIPDCQLIVHTAALLPDNPELIAARNSGIPVYERAKLLGALSHGYANTIGVSGTHGKTTVTAMIAHILIKCAREISGIIGGKLPLTGTNGLYSPRAATCVVEACEFADTFLHISPATAVILNIDADHMEYFKTMENLRLSFTRFADMARTVIYNADDENTRLAISALSDKKFVPVGLGEGNFAGAKDITLERQLPRFTLITQDGEYPVKMKTPGIHNVHNALAALAACNLDGISWEDAVVALESFGGAGRRFEIMSSVNDVTIVDDYAHHPKELEATLNAALGMGYRKVWAVFQPFTFSRTATLLDDFARVLQLADHCVLTAIKGSREVNTYGIHVSHLAEKIPGSVWFEEFRETAEYLAKRVRGGDLVITLGCGDPYKVGRILQELLGNNGR
ncbi:MAG: UDP-N-acetylmuramate--L-alanine ligase [Oscillospiraceae bacterium]|nr:UDP-N-acetylmuramate--L-alanine ligase [Oscillospiraceae bacterium]